MSDRLRSLTALPARLVALAAVASACGILAAPAPATPLAGATGPSVSGVWARTSAADAANGAAYFTVRGGSAADTLVGVRVGMDVAMSASLHRATMTKDGMMGMAPVKSVPVPARGVVAFRPGGFHVMLMKLKHPLVTGAQFKLTLVFARAGAVDVTATVKT